MDANKIKFYKYQSLAKDEHFEFLKNFLDQKIWLSPLEDFNDPFEGRLSFVASPEPALNDPEVFDEILKNHHLYGEPELTADELRKRLNSPEFIEVLKSQKPLTVKNIFPKHGALCLTPDSENIPMWAYYANDHKGCCVEFEMDFSCMRENSNISNEEIADFKNGVIAGKDIISFNLKAETGREFAFVKVRYSKDVPIFEQKIFRNIGEAYNKTGYIIRNSMGVKHTAWDHEKEYRLVSNSNSKECGLLQLEGYAPFLKITGVILGSRIDKKDENKIRSLCAESKNKIYLHRAVCSESDYKIIINADDEELDNSVVDQRELASLS